MPIARGAVGLLLGALLPWAAAAQDSVLVRVPIQPPGPGWGWEVSAWGGYTRLAPGEGFGGPTEASAGLRSAEMAVWPTRALRLALHYDNGLSLDALDLVRGSRRVSAYSASGLLAWGGRHLTRVEGGWRGLPGGVGQRLLKAEEVIFLPAEAHLKLGGWVGPRDDGRTEWLAYGGAGWSLRPGLRVEPTLFYSRSGLPGEQEVRGLVFVEHASLRGWRLGAGAAGGQAERGGPGESTGVWDVFALGAVPLWAGQEARLLVRHSDSGVAGSSTTVALGLAVGRRP